MVDHHIWQSKLPHKGPEERDGLPLRFDEGQGPHRLDDPEWETRDAGAGPNVHDPERPLWKDRPEEQRVEEEASRNCRARSETGQAVGAVPEKKQVSVALEPRPLLACRPSSDDYRKRIEERFEVLAARSSHQEPLTPSSPPEPPAAQAQA